MPSLSLRKRRRNQILKTLDTPLLLMAGGFRSRNYPQNVYPYRADSTFLFLFADPEPDSAALLDPADGSVTLFLTRRTPEDALWHGATPAFDEMKRRHGVTRVLPLDELEGQVAKLVKRRQVRALAVADPAATNRARKITKETLDFGRPNRQGNPDVVAAIAHLRLVKADEEIAAMRQTAVVTREAHVGAMTHTRPGIFEHELAGIVNGTFVRHGCTPAYNTILTVRGEVLHNVHHGEMLREPDIVLLDAGAESNTGYCSDVTRCWPVGGRFTPEGRAVYDLVLRAQNAAIAAVRPKVRFREIHLLASRVMAEGLVDLGLLRGKPDELVDRGAHALFFPHGLGHLIGLDVHDMEAFGDFVAYGPGRTRSEQFGLQYLRLDLDLQPGMVFTIEPGIYFVPAILRHPGFRKQFKAQVDFDRAEQFLTMNARRGFGGIRIEDDVVCTANGPEVLTEAIPKQPAIVEQLSGCAR